MRGIIFFLCLLISSFAFSQTTYYIQADSVRFRKIGANSEFILENSTRNIPGILVNKGNGRTEFSRARISGDTLFIGRDTVLGIIGSGVSIANLGSGYRLWDPVTPGMKSLGITNGLTPDSSTSGQIGIRWGGALTANTTVSGSNIRDVTFSGLDGFVITNDNNISITNTKSHHISTFEMDGSIGGDDSRIQVTTPDSDSTGFIIINEYSTGIGAASPAESSLVDCFPEYINFQQTNSGGGEYRFHNMQTRASSSGWKAMAWRHSDSTIVAIDFPTSGLSGSIADDQIAFGNGTSIAGSNNLTYNGTMIKHIVDGITPQFRIEGSENDGLHGLDIWRSNADGYIYLNATQGIGIFKFQDAGTDMLRLDNGKAFFTDYIQTETHGNFKEISAPVTPASGYASIYVKSDGFFYGKDDAGTETRLSNTGSVGIDDVLSVGQVLTTNRTIDASTFELSVSGSATSPNNTFEVTNSSSGTALQVTGTSGTAINITNSSGTGIISTSTTGLAGLFVVNPSSTNTAVAPITIRRQTSGTPAAGIAASLPFEVEGTGSTIAANTITSTLTAVGAGSQHSRLTIDGYNAGTPGTVFTLDGNGALILTGRFQPDKGADVASANDLTLGSDGNVFVITGTTTINAITTANWQAGSEITLVFTGATTVKHNTAGGGGTARMFLAGSVDLSTANHTTLTLVYDGTQWQEKSRKIP